jgi:HAD superfamily hydrolase (TIGR01549 family)
MNNNITYSFDIFDTCLIRNLAQPTDLFHKLALNIYGKNKNIENFEIIREIANYRINAEQFGRRYYPEREDISIDKFYKYFDKLYQWGIDFQEILDMEIELEFQSIKPILSTKHKINQLKKNNCKVIFISDMYLPQKLIHKMLLDHEIASLEDPIYVSGEVGLTKATGRLFKYVLEKEKLQPHQICHYGDNIYTDVLAPRKLGIKATHFKESQLNRYEKQIITLSHTPVEVRSQIAGVSRAVRLMRADETTISKELAGLASNIIAPLLTSYVAWVIQDANKSGIEKLYFVSRDGQILLKIAQQLAKYMPVPECHYLYGSRQAWFLPSIFDVSRDSLDWLVIPGQSNAPRDLLKKLEIEPVEIKSVLEQYQFDKKSIDKQLSLDEIERFWQVIKNPTVSSLILQKAQAARNITLKYFSQEGLCSESTWAIVDVGWTLKCQRSLKQILGCISNDFKIKGYYLGVFRNCLTTTEVGNYRAFLLQDTYPHSYPSSTEYIFRNQRLIEQVFTAADHPTVVGYEENGRILPLFKTQNFNSTKQSLIASLHQTILQYVDEIARTGLLNNQLEEFKICSINNAIEFFSKPKNQDVQPILCFQTGDDQNESRLRPVARQINIRDFIYFIKRFTHRTSFRDYSAGFDWLEGSVVISNPFIRMLFFGFTTLQEFVSTHKPVWIYQIWFQLTKKI